MRMPMTIRLEYKGEPDVFPIRRKDTVQVTEESNRMWRSRTCHVRFSIGTVTALSCISHYTTAPETLHTERRTVHAATIQFRTL
jgi:hypothetical protein